MRGYGIADVWGVSQKRNQIAEGGTAMSYISYTIIIILVIAVSILVLRLCLVKKQLRKIARQMEEPGEHFISVDFVDRDLETAALQINKLMDSVQNIKAESVKGEKAIKSSISMISHDMRTPLTSVIGYLQLAEKNCKEEEVLQYIRTALDRAKFCSRLVNDFFELSLVDADQYVPVMEKVNICEVVCEEILAAYVEFEKSGITPVFGQADDFVLVWADRKLLVRVMQNLISNGIKYSTGEMNFSVSMAGETNFSVSKAGKAVLYISSPVSQAVDAEKIFQKFYRGENSSNSDGAGLGLYICRKFIEDMRGKISADSDGQSLRIKIELSLCPAEDS